MTNLNLIYQKSMLISLISFSQLHMLLPLQNLAMLKNLYSLATIWGFSPNILPQFSDLFSFVPPTFIHFQKVTICQSNNEFYSQFYFFLQVVTILVNSSKFPASITLHISHTLPSRVYLSDS